MPAFTKIPRKLLLLAVVAMLALAGVAMGDAAVSFHPEFVNQLQHTKQIYVATLRKDGKPGAVVPVWFAVLDNSIWFATRSDSHKAVRVRRGSPMLVSVQGADGPFITVRAEIVEDGAVADRLGEMYAQKYWMAWLEMFRPSHGKLGTGKDVLIHLTPAP
jgi:general stress protein 26